MRNASPVREKAQSIVAVLALLVSVGSCWYTARQTHHANSIAAKANSIAAEANRRAEEANEYARDANLIAMGAKREYPRLEAYCPDSGPLRLTHRGHLGAWDFFIALRNTGEVPIEGVSVHLSPLPFCLSNPGYPLEEPVFRTIQREVDFDQQLVSEGVAGADLTILVVEFLRGARLEVDGTWTAGVKAVFAPRRLGDELPVRASRSIDSDTCFLTIQFSTEFLRSDEIDAFLGENPSIKAAILPPSAPQP